MAPRYQDILLAVPPKSWHIQKAIPQGFHGHQARNVPWCVCRIHVLRVHGLGQTFENCQKQSYRLVKYVGYRGRDAYASTPRPEKYIESDENLVGYWVDREWHP